MSKMNETHNEIESIENTLDNHNFREVTSEEKLIYQPYIENILNRIREVSYAQQYSKLLEGTYKVCIKQGSHLTHSRSTSNLSSLTQDANGCATGTAELIALSRAEAIPIKNLAAVDDIARIASRLTGQYYLTQISDRLGRLGEKVDKILDYIKEDREAEYSTTIRSIHELVSLVTYVEPGSMEAISCNQDFRRLRFNIDKRIFYIKKTISDLQQSISLKDETTVFMNKIQNLTQAVKEYQNCLLISFDVMINEILLVWQTTDPRAISTYITNLKEQKKEYLEDVNHAIEIAQEYTDRKVDKVDMRSAYFMKNDLFSSQLLMNNIHAKQEKMQMLIDNIRDNYLNTSAIDEIISTTQNIKGWSEFYHNPEFICEGNELRFTNCPLELVSK